MGETDIIQKAVSLESMKETIDFFYERYAIEADFADPRLNVLFPTDLETLIREEFEGTDLADVQTHVEAWESQSNQAWAYDGGIIVRPWINRLRLLHVLIHEYFHIVQFQLMFGQLAGSKIGSSLFNEVPRWIVEGSAQQAAWNWANEELGRPIVDTESFIPVEALAANAGDLDIESYGLYDNRRQFSADLYTVGWLSILRLIRQAGEASLLDFWRLSAPSVMDDYPRLDFTSIPSWEQAFVDAFGVVAQEHYEDFHRWRLTLPSWDGQLHVYLLKIESEEEETVNDGVAGAYSTDVEWYILHEKDGNGLGRVVDVTRLQDDLVILMSPRLGAHVLLVQLADGRRIGREVQVQRLFGDVLREPVSLDNTALLFLRTMVYDAITGEEE